MKTERYLETGRCVLGKRRREKRWGSMSKKGGGRRYGAKDWEPVWVPWQRQMEWEPPDLVEEAVYRTLSEGNWESRLKSRTRVKAINLSGVPGEIRQQSGWASARRGLVSVHTKSDFNMALRNQSLAHFLALFMLSYPASFGAGRVGILPGFFLRWRGCIFAGHQYVNVLHPVNHQP